jgi:hypothetical protein
MDAISNRQELTIGCVLQARGDCVASKKKTKGQVKLKSWDFGDCDVVVKSLGDL